ncbi:MAG: DNA repair protein RecO [Bacilli bacterium]|nr:DNA repair protein RecO [Bacilli bacterium]
MKDVIEGIVVSEVSYSETSKIINILTKDGIIGCMAKGAKGLKSNLRVGTTKITYGKFYISKKEEKLSILTSVDIINDFKNIKKDIVKISYATYIVDLASQVMKHNVDSNVFNILLSALIKINEDFSPVIITNILELKYLEYLGVMPIIDECAICGSKTSIATLSSSRGGYICNNCLRDDLIVSDKTIKLIRMFYYVDISKISNLDISNKSILEISNFLDDYYDRYTGLYLKSKKLLKNINKVS